MSDARKALRLLERANRMDFKSVMRLLRLSYGIQGKERHKLLKPFVDSARMHTLSPEKLSLAICSSSVVSFSSTSSDLLSQHLSHTAQSPQPLHFNNPRTVPPIMVPPLEALIRNVTGKSTDPSLPQPLFKPLHGRREANLRWRFFTKQLKKVIPPLPMEVRGEIERKSRIGLSRFDRERFQDISKTTTDDWIEQEKSIIQTIKLWNNNGKMQKKSRWENERFHPSIGGKPAKPCTMTLRLYRRIWQHLLDQVPVIHSNIKSAEPLDRKKGLPDESDATSKSNKCSFVVSKSPLSYQARYNTGLKLHSKVNRFDKIGLSQGTVPEPTQGRKKISKS
ncbi:hypothetical protein BX616_007763 [Lobosporangium transversale]|nr:hypothetical protein BX616_007763 [Lobosporangium transversale]